MCRYDSTQTTGGKKVRRFGDVKIDGRITFEEHERRTLPCSRLEVTVGLEPGIAVVSLLVALSALHHFWVRV